MEMCTLHTATGGCPWRDETTTWAIPTKIKCTCCCRVKNTGDFSQHKSDEKVRDSQRKCSVVTQEASQAVFGLQKQTIDLDVLHTEVQLVKSKCCGSKTPDQSCQWGPTVQQAGQISCRACAKVSSPWQFHFLCNRAFGSTLRGHVQNSPTNARHRAKARGQECSLDLHQVLDMLETQGGRCYYSGVPMKYISDFRPTGGCQLKGWTIQ